MAEDDGKTDSHKHRRKKGETPEWSETCIGFWSKTSKENDGHESDEQRRCIGISILHINKFADASKIRTIPTSGIEIVIQEKPVAEQISASRNLHPFLGIFIDENKVDKTNKDTESKDGKTGEDKINEQSDEVTPKILEQVAENWGKRCHHTGKRFSKYYQDPSSSAEILKDIKKSISNGYESTARILSYCHPQEKAKQVSNFISDRLKNISEWWKE